jgi:hypothetical protein
MGILPWVFYAWTNVSSLRRQLFAAIVTALFLLSHNLIPLITLPFLFCWVFLNKPTNIKYWIIPTIFTLTLSAFYLVPVLFERNFVQADTVARTTDYSLHFVSPSQLWNSVWGYGGSSSGIEDGMSFKVGKIQLLLAGLGSVMLIIRSKRKELFFIIAGIISLFMTTNFSSFLWNHIPLLPIVQFPWRFLVLGGFFVSILASYTVTLFHSPKSQSLLAFLIAILLLFFNLKYFVPQTTFKAIQTDFTSQSYLNTLPSIIPEYAPSWLVITTKIMDDSTVLPQLYYPTWEVKLDGNEVSTFAVNGYLAFDNPSGSTQYSSRQAHTGLENLASLISLIGLIIMIKLYVKN